MMGVIALDVLEGILMAVSLALLLLLRRSARPPDAVLVRVPGMKGFHDLSHHADALGTPGLLLYRFGAGIVFYNAPYLKKRVENLAAAQPDLKWVVVDGSTINTIDSTGAETLEALARELDRKGIRLVLAGFRTETRAMLERAGAMSAVSSDRVYPTLKSAMNAFLAAHSNSMTGGASSDNSMPDAAGKQEAESSNDPS
jgi:MFS superfamily sulfate permease-like transporter